MKILIKTELKFLERTLMILKGKILFENNKVLSFRMNTFVQKLWTGCIDVLDHY